MNTQIAISLFCAPSSRQRRARRVLRLLPCLFLVAALAPMPRAFAVDHYFVETLGDWDDGANWTSGVPGTSGWAHINDSRTAQITGALSQPTIWILKVGEGDGSAAQSGTVEHSAGQLTVTGNSQIGVGEDTTGTYDISGTSVLDIYSIDLGRGVQSGTGLAPANGVLSVSDSATVTTDWIYMGRYDNGIGTVTQTGGSVTTSGGLQINHGVFDISGGTYANTGSDVRLYAGEIAVSGTAEVDFVAGWGASIILNYPESRISVTGDQASVDVAGSLSVGCDWDGSFPWGSGTLEFNSVSGVSPIQVGDSLFLNDGTGGSGMSVLEVDMETSPPPAGDVLLLDVAATLTGKFRDVNGVLLDEGATVPGSGGRTITYLYDAVTATRGAGNDVALLDGGGMPTPGDFNGDDSVDADDLALWKTSFGVDDGADADNDGDSDGADLMIWQRNFTPPASPAVAVPEPTACALLAMAAASAASTARSRKNRALPADT